MAINREKNTYIFSFSIVLVVLVGAILAGLAVFLKPYQTQNIENEKKQSILQAIQVQVSREEATVAFDTYVQKQVVLNGASEEIGNNAFGIDIGQEYKNIKDPKQRSYPLYICEKDAKTFYVIPLIGTGLWGPIWGFVALESDGKTVYGANFDHKTETPGLGAEITESFFQKQFVNKKIADDQGNYTSIQVIKPGSVDLDEHKVDGITGGTLTSVGVAEMLERILKVYYIYLQKYQQQEDAPLKEEDANQEDTNTEQAE